jgi:hypothetical protein
MSDCIMDDLIRCLSYRLVISTILINSKLFTSCQEPRFVIMDPTAKIGLICKVLWTLLRGRFNVYTLILCV